jgi:hypothetical protein
MKRKLKVRHIGNCLPLCRTRHKEGTWLDTIREDLPYTQYRDMPKNKHPQDMPFKICKKCLLIIKKRDSR